MKENTDAFSLIGFVVVISALVGVVFLALVGALALVEGFHV